MAYNNNELNSHETPNEYEKLLIQKKVEQYKVLYEVLQDKESTNKTGESD